jgi:hypothetical protein
MTQRRPDVGVVVLLAIMALTFAFLAVGLVWLLVLMANGGTW